MGLRIPSTAFAALLLASSASAFVTPSLQTAAISNSARHVGVDPSVFNDLPQHLSHAFTSMNLADAVDTMTDVVGDPEEVVKKAGWFGFLTAPIALLLQGIHSVLNGAGMDSNSWGVSIVFLTVLIKVVTFPLTKTQLESTNKMQALQPSIKAIQEKYQSNPEVMNQKVADMYQQNEVNPLAGCLPSLVQIPVFIGLYRAVLELATDNKLDEGFLFLPNLEGPTYGADPAHGSDWLFQGWIDGVPALGWDDTIAFLALPIFLVISQVISMQIMQPKDSPTSNNVVLKLLPLMIGWFSLNVPAALTIYWVVNNIVTTTTTVLIRNSMEMPAMAADGAAALEVEATPSTIFAPPPAKPAGFGLSDAPVVDPSGVKPITSSPDIVDAVIEETAAEADAGSGMAAPAGGSKKKRGKKRKKKNN